MMTKEQAKAYIDEHKDNASMSPSERARFLQALAIVSTSWAIPPSED